MLVFSLMAVSSRYCCRWCCCCCFIHRMFNYCLNSTIAVVSHANSENEVKFQHPHGCITCQILNARRTIPVIIFEVIYSLCVWTDNSSNLSVTWAYVHEHEQHMGICLHTTHISSSKIAVNDTQQRTSDTVFLGNRSFLVCFCFNILYLYAAFLGSHHYSDECGGVTWVLLRTYASLADTPFYFCYCVKVPKKYDDDIV